MGARVGVGFYSSPSPLWDLAFNTRAQTILWKVSLNLLKRGRDTLWYSCLGGRAFLGLQVQRQQNTVQQSVFPGTRKRRQQRSCVCQGAAHELSPGWRGRPSWTHGILPALSTRQQLTRGEVFLREHISNRAKRCRHWRKVIAWRRAVGDLKGFAIVGTCWKRSVPPVFYASQKKPVGEVAAGRRLVYSSSSNPATSRVIATSYMWLVVWKYKWRWNQTELLHSSPVSSAQLPRVPSSCWIWTRQM